MPRSTAVRGGSEWRDHLAADVARAHIERILKESGWNLTHAAETLGIDRSTLYSKINSPGLKRHVVPPCRARPPHRHFLLAGHAASRPCRVVERTKQRDAGSAHRVKLLRKVRERPRGKPPVVHEVVLLETGEPRLIAPGDTQRPVRENSLGIRDVPENFLDRPF